MKRRKKDILSGVLSPITGSKFIAANTVEYTTSEGRYIRLHDTNVLSFLGNRIVLNSGGWKTHTTKDRLNTFLPQPFKVYSDKGIWYLYSNGIDPVPFFDGMAIRNGKILNVRKGVSEMKAQQRTKKLIRRYCNAIKELDVLPEPNAGDCFYCHMIEVKTKKPLGEVIRDKDHLFMHLKELYVHGSLLWNAITDAGYSNPGFIFQMSRKEDKHRDVTLAVRRYFKRQLGLA